MTMTQRPAMRDVIVIGGGPAGSLAARELARRGLDTLVLERSTHPRFRIGESFLPRTYAQMEALGLTMRLDAIPHMPKLGAEFVFGHGRDPSADFWFADALRGGPARTFNIERAPFDQMLLDAAREAGADVREAVQVNRVLRLDDGDVVVAAGDTEYRARFLIDASGQATVVGRHLRTRRALPDLQKVAYFAHFRGVHRRSGDEAGFPTIVMCRDGWFWLIPLDAERTSVGLVMAQEAARAPGLPASDMLQWGISSCPVMAQRCRGARPTGVTGIAADFSYSCRPYAGPGYFLVGDAAVFVDPIFSTGVCLGMMAAEHAALSLAGILRDRIRPARARRGYTRLVEASSSVLFRIVRGFYRHSFRELLMQKRGPMSMHRAIIALLAGDVFPRPALSLRWRLAVFEVLLWLNERVQIVPRREPFSLLEAWSRHERARSTA